MRDSIVRRFDGGCLCGSYGTLTVTFTTNERLEGPDQAALLRRALDTLLEPIFGTATDHPAATTQEDPRGGETSGGDSTPLGPYTDEQILNAIRTGLVGDAMTVDGSMPTGGMDRLWQAQHRILRALKQLRNPGGNPMSDLGTTEPNPPALGTTGGARARARSEGEGCDSPRGGYAHGKAEQEEVR